MSTENPNRRLAGTLKLIERDENAPKPLTGAQLLTKVSDLVAEHIAEIPLDDPYRVTLGILARRHSGSGRLRW
ncbi:MAG: hypothetical protein ACR2LK_04430 [Solirubrobacteraceae bacterium]